MTIAEACSRFLDEELRFRNLAQGTIEGYESIFRSLSRWAGRQGLAMLQDLDESAVRAWVKSWSCRPATTRQRLAQMKRFFRFAVERGWARRSPLARLRPPRSESPPTLPLTVPEMRALLATAEPQPKEHALILLMRYSGLAIGDAVTLGREALVGTELTLRRAKTGELVMVDLPHLVVRAVRRLRGASPDFFWWSGRGKRVTSAKYWRARLGAIAARAGVAGFHPHRLRDTFAVALLTAGVSIEDVSALLGHSSIQTTEKHYAPWDRRRRDRLTRVVRAANRLDPLLTEMDSLNSDGGGAPKQARRPAKTGQAAEETSLWSSQSPENWSPWNPRAARRHCRRQRRADCAPAGRVVHEPNDRRGEPGTRVRRIRRASRGECPCLIASRDEPGRFLDPPSAARPRRNMRHLNQMRRHGACNGPIAIAADQL